MATRPSDAAALDALRVLAAWLTPSEPSPAADDLVAIASFANNGSISSDARRCSKAMQDECIADLPANDLDLAPKTAGEIRMPRDGAVRLLAAIDLATAVRALVEHARRQPPDVDRALAALVVVAEEAAPADGPVKLCSCGARYDAGAWAALPMVGEQDDGTLTLELRNCVCGSTLGVVTGLSAEHVATYFLAAAVIRS